MPSTAGPCTLPAKPFIKRACSSCLTFLVAQNFTSELKLCRLPLPRALLQQRPGIRPQKGQPMAVAREAETGTLHQCGLCSPPDSDRSILRLPDNHIFTGHVLAQTARPKPFVDPQWYQTFLSKKRASSRTTPLRLRAPTSMYPRT